MPEPRDNASPIMTHAGIVIAAEARPVPTLTGRSYSGTMYATAAGGAIATDVHGRCASPIHTNAMTKNTP